MDKIDFSPVELMPPVIGTDIVLALQKALLSVWNKEGEDGPLEKSIAKGIKACPIQTNFPGSSAARAPLNNSSQSEPGDPSERSEGTLTFSDPWLPYYSQEKKTGHAPPKRNPQRTPKRTPQTKKRAARTKRNKNIMYQTHINVFYVTLFCFATIIVGVRQSANC
jgi:hypothetical protein